MDILPLRLNWMTAYELSTAPIELATVCLCFPLQNIQAQAKFINKKMNLQEHANGDESLSIISFRCRLRAWQHVAT